ncbi:MAG: SMC-Scp complex subunit ScpB, partial [Phycisphaerales bacterium]
MIDETQEISNEEDRATAEQPVVVEEETAAAEEVGEEPVQQEIESANTEEPVFEPTGTPVEDVPPEEGVAQSSDAVPTQASASVAQVDEALVERIDAAEPQDGEQTPTDSEQSPEGTEVCVPPASDLQPPVSTESPTVESVIEAILFASDEPLQESRLAGIVETTAKQVRESVESLNARYEAHGNAFRIEQIAGGYQMLTQPIYNSWLTKMVR